MKESQAAGEKLHELEDQGLARFHEGDQSGNGALPVLRLTERVEDLREVIKESKAG